MCALDLLVLTPDLDWNKAMEALLRRAPDLGIRPIRYSVRRDPMHDASVARSACDTLRGYLREAHYAMVTLDREGSGLEKYKADIIARRIGADLDKNGWSDRNAVVVLEPELESWVWCDPTGLADALRWPGGREAFLDWLRSSGWMEATGLSVSRPKEALLAALRQADLPRSSGLYGELAAHARLGQCTDASFQQMLETLRRWFPA